MDYKKHYDKLTNRAKNRILESYTERHHIIPRCMGGTDETDNLVDLTPEEHYVAHQLLVKMYPNEPKLVYAARMMTVANKHHARKNKSYGWLKRHYSEICRLRIGKKNSSYDTMWIHNDQIRENKKINKFDQIPTGWQKGRRIKWNDIKCTYCDKTFLQKTKEKYCSDHCRSNAKSKEVSSRKYSIEVKQKLSRIKKGTGIGKTNSQYGSIWITNGVSNKKIKKEDSLPNGWRKGRI